MGSESAIADGMAPKAASCALTQMQAEQDHDEIVHQACRKLNRLMLPFALLFRSAAAALSEACGHARLLMLSNSLTCVYYVYAVLSPAWTEQTCPSQAYA